jgi:predicted dehydrogenase
VKKLKVGIIGGGGKGSFFGKVHLRAILFDGTREVVAGALRSTPEGAMSAAEEWGIEGFPDYQSMIDAYTNGTLELDYVVIVTPNFAHYAPTKACLEAGLPVFCEKPMTLTIEEAEDLQRLVVEKDLPFVLGHTYTGHPMLMLAREFVMNGDIGEIRKVEAWYTQGWLASMVLAGGGDSVGAAWKFDPKRTGVSNCGGDIGTHALANAMFVTDLKPVEISARLNSFVIDTGLDDDFNSFVVMDNGATALINATQIAIGYKNDTGIKVYGTKGSLEWHQERAEKLVLKQGGADTIYWIGAGYDYLPESVNSYLRVPCGHNEDFFEAVANLHTTMERMVRKRKGEQHVADAYEHPGVDYGVMGLKFLKAAVDSSKENGKWTKI